MLRMKRAYEEPTAEDGTRVLVERLWPRGVSKERAKIDIWCKDVAPSAELRKWYSHDRSKWGEFRKRYLAELEENGKVGSLKRMAEGRTVTLVFSTKDAEISGARVLLDLLAGDEDQVVL